MTPTATAAPETSTTSPEDLRARVPDLKEQVEKLESSLASSRARLLNLLTERSTLVLPARSGKDRSAQKRLDSVDEQTPVLKRDIADDETALADLRRELVSAENAVELHEWELRRAEVRKLIAARLTGNTAAAIEKALSALETALQTALDEDEATAVAMIAFVPSLTRAVGTTLRSGAAARGISAGRRLTKLLPIDTEQIRWGRDEAFSDCDRRYYGDILEQLDGLELVF